MGTGAAFRKALFLVITVGGLAMGASFAHELRERAGLVTMRGQPVVLLGDGVKVGELAPDFTAVDSDWKPVKLSDFRGKTVILSAVPSLDTGVCAAQTRRFNEEAARLGDDVQVITISEDLPFAQRRFCQAEKIGNLLVVSDTVDREFGKKYGLLIKGLSLLARAVIVIDSQGRVAYHEIVPEVTSHPDYEAALSAARKVAGR